MGLRGEESRAASERGSQSGQATAIGGNNPMKNEKTTATQRAPQSGQAAAIGGNNPMKNEKGTAAGTAAGSSNATTGAAPRGARRENR